jgi:hypothetical protein
MCALSSPEAGRLIVVATLRASVVFEACGVGEVCGVRGPSGRWLSRRRLA